MCVSKTFLTKYSLCLDSPQQLTVIPANNIPQFLQTNNGVTIRGNNVVQVLRINQYVLCNLIFVCVILVTGCPKHEPTTDGEYSGNRNCTDHHFSGWTTGNV